MLHKGRSWALPCFSQKMFNLHTRALPALLGQTQMNLFPRGSQTECKSLFKPLERHHACFRTAQACTARAQTTIRRINFITNTGLYTLLVSLELQLVLLQRKACSSALQGFYMPTFSGHSIRIFKAHSQVIKAYSSVITECTRLNSQQDSLPGLPKAASPATRSGGLQSSRGGTEQKRATE